MARRYIGVIGDVNPIEHQGGVIYDAGYGPHLLYFQPWSDEGDDMVSVYEIPIGDDVLEDLSWVDWNEVADFIGMDESELRSHARSDNVHARASTVEAVGSYYGFGELDPQVIDVTYEHAEDKWGDAVDAAHRAQQEARQRRGNPHGGNPHGRLTYKVDPRTGTRRGASDPYDVPYPRPSELHRLKQESVRRGQEAAKPGELHTEAKGSGRRMSIRSKLREK